MVIHYQMVYKLLNLTKATTKGREVQNLEMRKMKKKEV